MSQNYLTTFKCEDFDSYKDELIDLIYKDPYGKKEKYIFKTDYFVKDRGVWFDFFKKKVLSEFGKWFLQQYKGNSFICENCWYQIYEKGNFHETHTHAGTNFTNVFYLQLPDKKNSTFIENESVDVLEGSLITFPGFIPHESKPNLSDTPKIIISFNSSIKINE